MKAEETKMIPPPWMIDELERQRREREARERPQLWIEIPEPMSVPRERPQRETAREPIVIEF